MHHRYHRSLFVAIAGLSAASVALGQERQLGALPPSLVWETTPSLSTELEGADEIAVDAQGNTFVLGYLPVERDFYVLKLGPKGHLRWSRMIGGDAQDYATGLALDDAGDVYVCGNTTSSDFPTVAAYQPNKNGPSDAFLVKLSGATGNTLYATHFGGSRHEWAHDVAIGPDGTVYIAGETDSADLEVVNPIQPDLVLRQCFCDDAFVTRFTPLADGVLFSTYLGGTFDDAAREIEVDAGSNVVIAGITKSADFPTRNPVQAAMGGGEFDAFVARIGANELLDFSTYLGGEDWDIVQGLDLDPTGAVYLAGSTQSIMYPTTPGAYQQQFVGGIGACDVPFGPDRNCWDMFVTKLRVDGSLDYSTYLGGFGDDEPRNLVVDDGGRAHVTGYTFSSDFPGDTPFGAVVVLRLSADGRALHWAFSHDTPGPNGGSAVALRGDEVFVASSVGLPYDTYVAKLQYPQGVHY